MAVEITHTIGTNGGLRHYTSISAWEAAQQRDLVAADQIEIGECYNDDVMTDRVAIAGWTTDTTRYIKLYTPAAQRHDGTLNTGFQYNNTYSGHAFYISVSNVIIEGISIRTQNAYYSIYIGIAGTGWIKASHNLIHDGTGGINLFSGTTNHDIYIWNNFIFDVAIGIYCWDIDPDVYIYSNSLYSCSSYGIYIKAGSAVRVKDTIVTGSGSDRDFYQTANFHGDSDYNASGAGVASTEKAPGGNSLFSCAATDNYTNITGGSEDLHIKDASADIYQTGTNLSADPDLSFNDDIDGDTRTATWDIGADLGLIPVTKTATYGIDVQIAERQPTALDFDVYLVNRTTDTFELDSIFKETKIDTLTLDAYISRVIRFTLDSIFRETKTDTFTLDAMFTPAVTTHTVGADPSRDYSSLMAWEAAQQRDLVALDEREEVWCYNDNDTVANDSPVIAGWTTDVSHYIKITSLDTERDYGPAFTGAYWIESSYDRAAVVIMVMNVWVDGLRIDTTKNYSACQVNVSSGSGWIKYSNNRTTQFHTAGFYVYDIPESQKVYAWNNMFSIITAPKGVGIYVWPDRAITLYVLNNSAYGLDYGIYAGRDKYSLTLYNNVFLGNDTLDFSFAHDGENATVTGSDNMSTDSSAPIAGIGTGGHQASDNYRDIASTYKDLRIKDADADILFTGIDRSGYSLLPFSDDMIAAIRTAGMWSVGAVDHLLSWYTLDAILLKTNTDTFTLDAYLLLTSTFTIDTILKQTRSATFSMDVIIAPFNTMTLLSRILHEHTKVVR